MIGLMQKPPLASGRPPPRVTAGPETLHSSPGRQSTATRAFSAIALAAGLAASPAASGQSLELQGVLPGGKAVVATAGSAPKIVQAGAVIGDVRVVSVEASAILVESAGRRSRIELGAGPLRLAPSAGASATGDSRVVLTADSRGHFITTGYVNGRAQTFLVDTGASIVALSAADARRLGLDIEKGRVVQANTANGPTYGMAIRLDTLKVGGIVLHNVEAWVLDNLAGPALLGMTFLNRTAMQRDGGTMTLVKRF